MPGEDPDLALSHSVDGGGDPIRGDAGEVGAIRIFGEEAAADSSASQLSLF